MMWCTRWFLPLLLLPLPTAPPYFLVLFVFSITLHAKPCFYCIVLLTTLFVSSCYWQPFPVDNSLTAPWSENITTFTDAVKATLPSNSTVVFPSVMRAVDRCWCDFTGSFFEPFNVSHWEYLSVMKVVQELERKQIMVSAAADTSPEKQATAAVYGSMSHLRGLSVSENLWNMLFFPFSLRLSNRANPPPDSSIHEQSSTTSSAAATPSPTSFISPSASHSLEGDYDLRPYGLGLVVDLGW